MYFVVQYFVEVLDEVSEKMVHYPGKSPFLSHTSELINWLQHEPYCGL